MLQSAVVTPKSHTLAGVLSRLNQRDDPELARRLDAAFGKHEARLHSLCRRELPGRPEAEREEIVQDTLATAWQSLSTYRPERPFLAFLEAILYHKCANARRKRRDCLSEDGLFEPVSEAPSALDVLGAGERAALVEAAYRAVLEPKEQEVAHLRWVLHYAFDEVVVMADLGDADEVRVILQRCKRRIAKELERLLAERGLTRSFLGLGVR
ncbi:MAG: RNA polymerase sigma factor [Myxococcota bacterium]